MIKTHDTEATATYYLLEETAQRIVAKTVLVSPHCNVDVDEDGYPIGVEVI